MDAKLTEKNLACSVNVDHATANEPPALFHVSDYDVLQMLIK